MGGKALAKKLTKNQWQKSAGNAAPARCAKERELVNEITVVLG
jgi:hypothetical protein